MIDIVVRSLLGTSGQVILDFYLKNSIWINALILLYFLLLILAQRNYRLILPVLVAGLKSKYPALTNKKTSKEIAAFLHKHEIPWEMGLNASRLPFIAMPRNLLPRLMDLKTLQKLYPVDLLAEQLAKPVHTVVTP